MNDNIKAGGIILAGAVGALALVFSGGSISETVQNFIGDDTQTDRDNDPKITRGPETSDRDCSDFSTQREAQRFFENEGGLDGDDYHGLDRDKDGVACQSYKY